MQWPAVSRTVGEIRLPLQRKSMVRSLPWSMRTTPTPPYALPVGWPLEMRCGPSSTRVVGAVGALAVGSLQATAVISERGSTARRDLALGMGTPLGDCKEEAGQRRPAISMRRRGGAATSAFSLYRPREWNAGEQWKR